MNHMPLHPQALRLFLPVMVLVALIEAIVLAVRRPQSVDWRESLATLGVALGHTLIGLMTRSMAGGVLLLLWPYRLFTVPVNQPVGLLALLLASEFFYYWEHRWSHTMRWFWASHRVHHSTQHLNFSAAYRLGWTGTLSGLPLIFMPMVLLGFAPMSVALMLAVNLMYQFWLHNEWIPKLGAFEWVFNTPSSHRVHHARNAQYLDRNYGGILIVFDRLFGTYSVEAEACEYGLVHAIQSYNPVHIALGEWQAIWRELKRCSSWRGRFVTLFGAPSNVDPVDAQRVDANGSYDAAFTSRGGT